MSLVHFASWPVRLRLSLVLKYMSPFYAPSHLTSLPPICAESQVFAVARLDVHCSFSVRSFSVAMHVAHCSFQS